MRWYDRMMTCLNHEQTLFDSQSRDTCVKTKSKMEECNHVDFLVEPEQIEGKVKQFLQAGCGCSRGPKDDQCSRQFSEDVVLRNLKNCMELSHGEVDLVILENIQALFTGKEVMSMHSLFCV